MLNDMLVDELREERFRQIKKGFDEVSDDENKSQEDFCNDIESYVVWARQMARMGAPLKYRKRMMQIAAMAIAACESFDRKESN